MNNGSRKEREWRRSGGGWAGFGLSGGMWGGLVLIAIDVGEFRAIGSGAILVVTAKAPAVTWASFGISGEPLVRGTAPPVHIF